MYTKEQVEFMSEINQLVKDQGEKFAVGYLSALATAMLPSVKTRTQQKSFLGQLREFNGSHPVEVKNLMTGLPVIIPRREVGTCTDPSQERHWSM
jgi:hypothetical protein